MRNPFTTSMRPAPGQYGGYVPVDNGGGYAQAESDNPPTDVALARTDAVQLDDGDYPDSVVGPLRANIDPLNQTAWPAYAGIEDNAVPFIPVQQGTQVFQGQFALPDPTVGSVPGTASLPVRGGPVTGDAMDVYQDGNVQQTSSQPPGAFGPVVGGTDQSQLITQAYYQQLIDSYSTASSDQAMVRAI